MINVIKNVKISILDNKFLMLKVMILFILKKMFYIEQTINCYIDIQVGETNWNKYKNIYYLKVIIENSYQILKNKKKFNKWE